MKRVASFLLIALCGISFNLTACTHHSSENPQVKTKKNSFIIKWLQASHPFRGKCIIARITTDFTNEI